MPPTPVPAIEDAEPEVSYSQEPPQPRPSSSLGLTRESVSTVTDGLSFLVNSAKLATEFGFAAAKFTTSASINAARTVVDTVGENTGLDATGITPLLSGGLYLADKISVAGIGVGEYFTKLGLKAAEKGIDGVGNVFGNTELGLAIQEFSELVQRELERDLMDEDTPVEESDTAGLVGVIPELANGETTETALIARTPSQLRRRKNLKDIGAFEIAKSVTAWICLQRMNKKYYEEKALQACGESLLASFSASARLHHADSQLGLENGGPIIEELQDDDVVVDGESRRESADLIYAHVGSGPSETTTQPPSFDPLSQERLFQNIRRYIRFSSGAYGKFAMDFFAPNALSFNERKELARKAQSSDSAHINHAFYSTYTARPMPEVFHTTYHNQKAGENRLLSEVSSVPRILPANKTHYNPTFYLILDHPNKSVVLCLRGTLSLHDLFVDLTCESQEVQIQGAPYLVHSGMYRAAQRVSLPADQWLAAVQEAELPSRASSSDLPNLFRADPRPPFIHEAVLAGLQAHPGYSLVVTGHSLGAGLAALITLAWGDANTGIVSASSGFPSGTKLHCFAYASPAIVATVDPVSRQTRSTQEFHRLVTSVTAGTDFVPSFGLGSVRDVAGVVARMHDSPGLASGIVARYVQSKAVGGLGGADVEAVQRLHRELHDACFRNAKLFPVGRHFWIKQEAEVGAVDVREVERVDAMLGNLVFGPSMCSDHMPNVYEDLIRGL